MPTAVYTAIYGAFDELTDPVEQDVEVDWYCFTDNPNLTSDRWKVILEPPRSEDPRLSAKWPKMHPHKVLPDHRWTIWIDANLTVDSPSFVRESLLHAQRGLGVFLHPFRYCIYHEAFACLRRRELRTMPVIEQVRHYREEGHPQRAGLWACGVIARDSAMPLLNDLGSMWFEECAKWTGRDQLSFPVVLSRLGLEPEVFPFHIGREPAALALGRYFGMTPGTFPSHMLTHPEARALCPWIWFPPLKILPTRWDASAMSGPLWRGNPWFHFRSHVESSRNSATVNRAQ